MPPPLEGDVNYDGRVSPWDMWLVYECLDHIVGDPPGECDACDLTGDGKVNWLDILVCRNRLCNELE